MKTLIELYDDRPIENVLASEVFRPDRTVFLSPQEVVSDKTLQKKLKEYFNHRGLDIELVFLESSLYNSSKLLKQFRYVSEKYGDCMIDITGGTDAALFACGMFCAETDVPAFTYSRRRGCFYNIHNASFADELKCTVEHSVEDCFLMAGGAMRTGRVDNSILYKYLDCFDAFFAFYLKNRIKWTSIIKYIQEASQTEKGDNILLHVEAPYTVQGERGVLIDVPENCLYELERMQFLSDVRISREKVKFSFKDYQIRAWLRDIGSVLELYVYKACLDSGLFNDIRMSALVDWEGDFRQGNVTNEIDVMAMQGILPVFISCKTCEVNTEALNELSVLRDRFGGQSAKAAVVTSKHCQAVVRHRATELGIDIIDLNDLKEGRIIETITALMRRE